MNNPKHPTW